MARDTYRVVTTDMNRNGEETYDYYFAKELWREAVAVDPTAYVFEVTSGDVVFGQGV